MLDSRMGCSNGSQNVTDNLVENRILYSEQRGVGVAGEGERWCEIGAQYILIVYSAFKKGSRNTLFFAVFVCVGAHITSASQR